MIEQGIALCVVALLSPGIPVPAGSQAQTTGTVRTGEKAPEAQDDEDLRKRTEWLEKLVEELLGEVKALNQRIDDEEGVQREQAKELAEIQRAVDGIRVQQITDRMEGHDPKHFTVPGTETVATISGFVKGSGIHDSDEINSPTKFVTSKIVVDGDPGGVPSSRTQFHANDSRFIIGTTSKTDIGTLKTVVSMDFFGNTEDSSPDPRLRQAYGELESGDLGGKLLAGQAWSTWDDVASLPETLDFQGPPGSFQTRHTQARYTRDIDEGFSVAVGIEDPSNSIENGDSRTRLPDGVLAAAFHGDWGHVKPAAIFRDVGGNGAGTGTQRDFGWGLSVSSTTELPFLGPKDDLRVQIGYGEGIGSYLNDSGVDDAVLDGNDLKVLPVFCGSAGVQHWWQDKVRSNLVFGWVNVDNEDGQTGDSYHQTLYTAANLIYSPVDHIDVGTEVLWGERTNNDDSDGDAFRVMVSAKIKF